MVHFSKPQYPTVVPKKKDIPKGVWVKCPLSGEIVFNKDLEANQMVVPKSGYHFRIGARERLKGLLDPDTFKELGAEVRAADPLAFVDSQRYPDRLKKYEKDSGLTEAVVCGTGRLHGIPVALAVMDFRFCGGAMGGIFTVPGGCWPCTDGCCPCPGGCCPCAGGCCPCAGG